MEEWFGLTLDNASVRRLQFVVLAILPSTFIALLIFFTHCQSASINISGFSCLPGVRPSGGKGNDALAGIMTNTVLCDLPQSSILTPVGGQIISGTTYIITGAASSDYTEVQKIEISINCGDWDLAEGTSPWVYTWTLPSSDGSLYTIRSMATDIDSRQEIPGKGITITVDNVIPTCGITKPLTDGEVISGTEYLIEGWASDGLGVRQVEVTTNNGSNWDLADGTNVWSYNWTLDSNSGAMIRVRTTDLAGNVNPLCAERDILVWKYIYLPVMMLNYCPQVPLNGGFETGNFTYWTHDGELAQTVQSDVACQCKHAALLGNPGYPCAGGVPVGKAWIQRTFTVTSTGSPVLSFCYRIMTYDHIKWTDGVTLGDSFDVYVQGNLVLRDGYDNYPNPSPRCRSLQDLGWKSFHYDLSSYKGQDIQVRFENWNRHDGWYNTWTYVDAVQITN